MNYELLRAKSRKFIEAGELYIEILNKRGDVPDSLVSKLSAYRLPLSLMIGDKHFGAIAKLTLESVDAALDYAKSKKERDAQRMVEAHRASDTLIYKFMAEMTLGDVKNGD